MILVDANVLLRLIQIGHPHQQPALDAMALLRVRDREQSSYLRRLPSWPT
jgi:predicted nucleic acid-binding protein